MWPFDAVERIFSSFVGFSLLMQCLYVEKDFQDLSVNPVTSGLFD